MSSAQRRSTPKAATLDANSRRADRITITGPPQLQIPDIEHSEQLWSDPRLPSEAASCPDAERRGTEDASADALERLPSRDLAQLLG